MDLPNTLHGLLKLALKDLASCARSKNYTIDMCAWHEVEEGTCFVCMAGAVMSRTLDASIHETYGPEFYAEEEAAKLAAINWLRIGDFRRAFGCLNNYEDPDLRPLRLLYNELGPGMRPACLDTYPESAAKKRMWWAAWHKIAAKLEEMDV